MAKFWDTLLFSVHFGCELNLYSTYHFTCEKKCVKQPKNKRQSVCSQSVLNTDVVIAFFHMANSCVE